MGIANSNFTRSEASWISVAWECNLDDFNDASVTALEALQYTMVALVHSLWKIAPRSRFFIYHS
jgi:hypothetical protein